VILASARQLAEECITATNPTENPTSSQISRFLTKMTLILVIVDVMFSFERTTSEGLLRPIEHDLGILLIQSELGQVSW
jgi:hypothetical protein